MHCFIKYKNFLFNLLCFSFFEPNGCVFASEFDQNKTQNKHSDQIHSNHASLEIEKKTNLVNLQSDKIEETEEVKKIDYNYMREFWQLWEDLKQKKSKDFAKLAEMLSVFLVAGPVKNSRYSFYINTDYIGKEKELEGANLFAEKFFNYCCKAEDLTACEYQSKSEKGIKFSLRIPSKESVMKVLEKGPMAFGKNEKLLQGKTNNNMGSIVYIHNALLKEYIKFATEKFNDENVKSPAVLDIGAATGANDYDILKKSTKGKVYANDLSKESLFAFRGFVKKDLQNRLYLNDQHFPSKLDYPENKFDAIIISHVFHYLSPEEIQEGLKKAYTWLKPGGKIFIQALTVYADPFKCFIPTFIKNKKSKVENPSFFENWEGAKVKKPCNFPEVVHPIMPKKLDEWMKKAGFESDVRYGLLTKTKSMNPLSWEEQEAWVSEKKKKKKEIMITGAEKKLNLQENAEWFKNMEETKKIFQENKENPYTESFESMMTVSAIGTKKFDK